MNAPDYWSALRSLRPSAGWVAVSNVITEWYGADPQPTDDEVAAELARLTAEWNATKYQRLRAAEYPRMDSLIVALWEAEIEGRPADAATLQAIREAVKAKYPKPVPS
jgi:hypothetical protein